ncbi:MAG: hypothetical protein Q4B28_03900 [bacterium]|nr:hypothetical protein [bacterium]
MTQRSYKVPRVDEINLTDKLRKTPLQGIDYQIDSFLNLQYNFDGFYAFIKSTTDGINNRTQLIKDTGNIISNHIEDGYAHLEQLAQSGVNNLEEQAQNWIDKQTDNINETINNDNNKQDANLVKAHLNKQLQTAIDQLHTPHDKAPFQQILALTEQNTQIQANHSDYQHIHQQVQNILNQHKSNASELANLVKKDYDRFLLTLDTHNNKEQSPQLAYTTSLLTPNPQAEHLFKNNHIIDEYVQLQSQQINGYLNALEQHGAKGLNMSNSSYLKSKNYLNTLSQHIKHYYAMRSSSYAGSTPLITKSGVSSHKPLLTQIPNTTPNTTTTQSADYSDFVKGVLVKSTDQKSLINVVNSEYNYEKYQHYYQQDINNDKKADLIARDEYNIYIKYADDAIPTGGSHYKHYYQLTPSLKNKTKKYEKSNGDLFKLYDHTAEVKNFELIGQTFDALSFGWTHHNTAQNHGYLIKISDRIDSMKEKFDTDQLHYVLILPR